MSDKITQARTFYNNYLDQNRLTPGEHSSVLALVAYLDANSTAPEEYHEDLKTELESLKTTLESKIADHNEILKQRDHNWNELQKAQKEIATLKAQVTELKNPKVETKPEETK